MTISTTSLIVSASVLLISTVTAQAGQSGGYPGDLQAPSGAYNAYPGALGAPMPQRNFISPSNGYDSASDDDDDGGGSDIDDGGDGGGGEDEEGEAELGFQR
jgi:hypothetical protein